MATFKHISSKNADYGAAEQYLTFEHDEFTMKPTLDKNGRLVLRDDYRISSLNCGDEDFAIACMRSNLKYSKNQKREDVKSHHYIISFDPRDAPDNGLTVDRAQQLGEQFCKEHFPGHQALVCTHPDGNNHSGNIHVHIVINSLRIAEVPLLPYMERPADTREGCKHRCTDAAMEYFKAEVMEMCHRENLYQIDLLHFKAQGISKLPASKALQTEIEQLTKEKNALYNEYREKKENVRELQTVKSNLDKILRREPERGKGRENER
ncbi:protein rlx [bacterium 1xD8-48]|nr:protein rlx [bacterium 1xD8-48]